MSELREKIIKELWKKTDQNEFIKDIEYLFQSELEKQRDEFAVGFNHWKDKNAYPHPFEEDKYQFFSWHNNQKIYTLDELLEKYKQRQAIIELGNCEK